MLFLDKMRIKDEEVYNILSRIADDVINSKIKLIR